METEGRRQQLVITIFAAGMAPKPSSRVKFAGNYAGARVLVVSARCVYPPCGNRM